MVLLNSKTVRTSAALALALAAAACGGGKPGNGHGPNPGCAVGAGCNGGGGSQGAPAITAEPQSQSVLTGAVATFTVSARGGNLSYQWGRNGVAIAGATAASYTTPPASHLDHGAQYNVVVTGANGTVVSAAAVLTLTLSADQQIFQNSLLAGGSPAYRIRWNLNFSGPQTSGVNYAYSEHGNLVASPLTAGPQVVTQSAPLNLTTSLSIANAATPANSRPVRVLKNGVVLVVPGIQETRRFTYVGSTIRSESLALDNVTGAHSVILSGYSVNPVSGALSSTPPEMAQWFNSFFSNAAILVPGATYAEGSSYIKFTATNEGDRYDVLDCGATTFDANVTACYSGTTLEAAMTTGITSPSDGRTYTLTDGVLTTVAGIPMWVANLQRPVSATFSSTIQYRTYFQLNGNVYTGMLTRDGAVIGGNYFVSNPGAPAVEDRLTFFPYQLRLNKAAHDSLHNAIGL